MTYKSFNNEREARVYRDQERDKGYAASLFIYGKDRYRVRVIESSSKKDQQENQHWLSSQAWRISEDIKDLAKVKELIASPDFGCEVEDIVFVAKKLEKERWFKSSEDVIGFFDYPAKSIEKIKGIVDTALKEYYDDWNEYLEVAKF